MHAGCILCILLPIVPLSGITLKHKQCNCNSGAVKINANLKILTAAIVHKIYRRASVRCILPYSVLFSWGANFRYFRD